jgi:hypothetical protein
MYDISADTILKAAKNKYGADVQVSAPYFVDHEIVRVGIADVTGNLSFGANFFYKDGVFR